MGKWRAHILLGLGLALISTRNLCAQDELTGDDGQNAGFTTGPDVIVSTLYAPQWWGKENTLTGLITALSIGTQSCNIGNAPIFWEELPSLNHPVIRGSMFRLKDHKFEQIGISWVKHGFYATNDPDCGWICTAPGGHGGTALYPGCSDPYDAGLNGTRNFLGPTWQINAHTGTISGAVSHPSPTGQRARLQVHNVDLDPALNSGARYYVESQYVTADDAAAGNGNNNATHQRALVVPAPANPNDSCEGDDPQKFCVVLTDFARDTEPAIRAWKNFDPTVVETEIQVPGEGLFILAAKARDMGTGFWRYEYALHNLNSDRSAKSFTVPVAVGASVASLGFHDIEYHSGEPFDNTDWTISSLPGKIIWSGQDYSVNQNANALRWGTLYNFRFDANAPPGDTTITINLFKPGAPDRVNVSTIGPIVGFIDCNNNSVADACDTDCNGVGCEEPCGTSEDCNNNVVPDECETDCNENGIADTCDLIPIGESEDCNANTVPDECEEDCNQNGIPDTCEAVPDTDNDGWDDCEDQCPTTTPPNACEPPAFTCCYYESSGISIPSYPYNACLSQGGTPLCDAEAPGTCDFFPVPCPTSFCREGCLVGDGDGDGDFDLADFEILMQCYTGDSGSPAFVEPTQDCSSQFDFDENGAIDLEDIEQFRRELAGPQ